ncbi:MAG: toll/interleukin-1 receptor domain-containing protein [Nostoc sp. NMS7]|uniref:toll/interleukin-1 receptor domain-containing protein n=1 Tax=Nostoc sp. NMS7 TaxID=2815391 RepID=UPI0025DF462C|nr:toll/interleukin-1 receptor domain-containing protein [Nostoc sp. NMS7]MBN3951726.1 toll/interleukin-1 receptor domain-containing protein [Nostoc sp. NMS7]
MFVFTVTSDTFLKAHPSELEELAEYEKLLIQVKSVLEVISYAEEEEYYRITLKNSIKGKDIWFVRKKYIKISVLQDLSEYTAQPPPSTQGSRSFPEKELDSIINSENIREGLESSLNVGVGSVFRPSLPEFKSLWDRIEVEEEEVIKRFKTQLQETPTIQERSSQPADITKDLVDCSVFSPSSVTPDDMFLVQVFVHLPEQVELAKHYAQQFDPDAKQLGAKSLGVPIQRGSELTFNLSIPKLEVDDPIQQLSWNGRADSIQFGVTVPADITQKTVIGTVTVSQNTIPLGHLKFKLSIIPSASSTSKNPQLVGEVARHYTKAFVSYSSKDRTEVLKRVQGLVVSGITIFQDILNLEPGDRWEQELYRHIDQCDLFLLFWSTAAKESPWVLKEVLYALERQGSDGLRSPEIIPVIIEGPPLVPPPSELQNLHFNDKLLYLMAISK